MTDAPVLGVVLAGGLGQRMGQGDKPLRRLAGRPLLDHVLERFAPQVDALILSANGDAARFAAYRLPVVADSGPEPLGPLGGILAAMDWAARHRPDVAVVASVPGDAPFLPRDLVARLAEARRASGAAVACAESAGRMHPLDALWSVDLRDGLRRSMAEQGLRKVGLFAQGVGARRVDWPVVPFDPFFNVNTPEDLAEAERRLASAHDSMA